ncbi:MAG TPA: TIM barrel protein, partial [Syntrophales bacterium]|nr:TIM barrel protein [Syntrophales bacterium]
ATETLALGINMPARTVVLERLVKFNGEQHLPLTPGEYTQLTGRAGRCGIDVEGHAVVIWNPQDSTSEPVEIAGLADTTIALENVYEKTPHQLCRLFRGLDAANLIFCFDAGHFNAFSNRSFEQWMEELGPFLGQLHLHDNSGVADEHLPVGDGNFPFARLFSTVEEMKVRPIITLEPHTEENFWKTLKNLETIGLPA